jgi:hypothetical protein
MGIVYFSFPVVGGYYLMQYVGTIAEKNLKNLKEESAVHLGTQQQNAALGGMLDDWKHKDDISASHSVEKKK